MADLYADEDFPQPAVEALRALGHDVLTAGEDGRAGQGISDADVAALAGRIDAAIKSLPTLAGQLVRVIRPNP